MQPIEPVVHATSKLDTTGLVAALEGAAADTPTAVGAYNGSNVTQCLRHLLAECSKAWEQFENGACQTLSALSTGIAASIAKWSIEQTGLVQQRDIALAEARGNFEDQIKTAVRQELDKAEGVVDQETTKPDTRTPLKKKLDGMLFNLEDMLIRATGWVKGRILKQDMKTVKRVALTFGAVYAAAEIGGAVAYFSAKGDQVGSFLLTVLFVMMGTILADFSGIKSRIWLTALNARSTFRKNYPKGFDQQGNQVSVNPIDWADILQGPGAFLALVAMTGFILNFRLHEAQTDDALKGTDIRAWLISMGLLVNWFLVFCVAPRHSAEVQDEYFKALADYEAGLPELQDEESAQAALAEKDGPIPTEPIALAIYTYRKALEAAQAPILEAQAAHADNVGFRTELLEEYRDAHRRLTKAACNRQIASFVNGLAARFAKEGKSFDKDALRQQIAGETESLIEEACPRRLENAELDYQIAAFHPSVPSAENILTAFDDVVETIRKDVVKTRQDERTAAAERQLKNFT